MHLGSDRFLSESSRKSFRLDSVPIQEKISWTAIHPKIGKAVCSQSTWYPFSLQKKPLKDADQSVTTWFLHINRFRVEDHLFSKTADYPKPCSVFFGRFGSVTIPT